MVKRCGKEERRKKILMCLLDHCRAFAAIAGMSPCMGVPPVDYFFYGSPASSSDLDLNDSRRRRRRHFSLEETCDELLDTDSSSSNDSALSNKGLDSCDLNPIKSFINGETDDTSQKKGGKVIQRSLFLTDLSFGSDDNSSLCCLDQPGDASLIPSSIVRDFEARLRSKIENSSPENMTVSFPEGLLSVIAAHVLQEAMEEPYGIKGCLLHINYEGDTALHRMATLDCDPGTLAKTFELTLTLRQGQSSWGQRMAR